MKVIKYLGFLKEEKSRQNAALSNGQKVENGWWNGDFGKIGYNLNTIVWKMWENCGTERGNISFRNDTKSDILQSLKSV